MGYGLEAFRIHSDDALIFGSKDEELLADVLETRGKRLAGLDEELGIGHPGAPTSTTQTTASRQRKR